ncbi:hypothetical protein [Sorangium sp. So ce693]|uniref:hypothetical protein n=1 Tax=Sorangium sp. So ce693 TaxID=3133318 RepID=UPI003F5FA788
MHAGRLYLLADPDGEPVRFVERADPVDRQLGGMGCDGQPQIAPDNPNAFTGQAQNPGSSSYQLTINMTASGASGTTVILNPSVSVLAPSGRAAA